LAASLAAAAPSWKWNAVSMAGASLAHHCFAVEAVCPRLFFAEFNINLDNPQAAI
jgi:hypothetical protein